MKLNVRVNVKIKQTGACFGVYILRLTICWHRCRETVCAFKVYHPFYLLSSLALKEIAQKSEITQIKRTQGILVKKRAEKEHIYLTILSP